MYFRSNVVLAALLASSMLSSSCSLANDAGDAPPEPAMQPARQPEASSEFDSLPAPIRVERVADLQGTVSLQWPGHVSLLPEKTTIQTLPIEGTITEILVVPGQRVEKGDVLARVRSPRAMELRAELTRAQSQLRRAREVEATQSELLRSNAGTPYALRNAIAEREQAEALVRGIEASLAAISSSKAGEIEVRALVAGQLFELNASLGQTVTDLERGIWVIADEDAVAFRALVPTFEGDLAPSAKDLKVRIGSATYDASFVRSTPVFQASSHRTEHWFTLSTTATHLVGRRGSLHVEGADQLLRVPTRSVVMNRDGRFQVWVREELGALEPRPVTIGQSQGGFTVIEAGLTGEEFIVTAGALLLDAEASLAL